MAIEYNRTMKIRYEHDERLNQKKEAKLAKQLQNKGLNMIDSYWGKVPEYGYTSMTSETVQHGIYIDGELIFSVNYSSNAKEIVEGLLNKFDDVNTSRIASETTKKEWVAPKGDYLVPIFNKSNHYTYIPTEDSLFDFKQLERNCQIMLDNGVGIRMELGNNYGGIELIFKTYWDCETVQRKEAIEENMVNYPLEIIGKVQSVVERVLKTKQFGYDVENVEIDCNFKAITLNESKCTPDIIRMTREARKNGN